MLNTAEAKIYACDAIAELFGLEYFKSHYNGACEASLDNAEEEIDYWYFLGFEGDEDKNLWTVFATVSVNRETHEVKFLDYKTPEGKRMENPIEPTSFAK